MKTIRPTTAHAAIANVLYFRLITTRPPLLGTFGFAVRLFSHGLQRRDGVAEKHFVSALRTKHSLTLALPYVAAIFAPKAPLPTEVDEFRPDWSLRFGRVNREAV